MKKRDLEDALRDYIRGRFENNLYIAVVDKDKKRNLRIVSDISLLDNDCDCGDCGKRKPILVLHAEL